MLTKQELCRLASQECEGTRMSIEDMKRAYDAICRAAQIALKEGETVVFTNLVKLIPQVQEEHQSRNPGTGEIITVPAKAVVKARVMPVLKREMADIRVNKFRKALAAK